MKQYLLKFTRQKIFWPLTALALFLVLNLFIDPGFFEIEIKNNHLFGSLIDILNRSIPLVIISIGMTLVIAKEGIDISVGSVLAISGATAAAIMEHQNIWLALIVALIVGIVCGFWNGLLVSVFEIQPMVATLILLVVGRGIAQLITGGQILTMDNEIYSFIGTGFLFGFPFPIYIGIFVFLMMIFLKKRTAMGLFLESIGNNMTASKFAGIQPKKIILLVYTICGLCAAIAGIIVSANVSSADANNAGLWIELDAILAVVIGGTSMRGGRYFLGGTVVGALFIQTLSTTIYSIGINPQIVMVVKALVVILVCLMQSESFRRSFANMGKKKVSYT
ncbi:simple sugar transport system permease protein [Gracilibacillus orientalis]|uniref:Simple sugar transport system permease protein n=1 Tax=Gracilibacillus orientalis TaxID=334253 RepID=A0A1I4HUW0_9BACI|nr:ABC transporter permease [Gracilibacillus orientalis]SFL45874.1 simple sugar transport system permease protein [Gracilibacillus orientalis]